MGENPDVDKYHQEIRAALAAILGDSGAKAILFYMGETTPETLEPKLRSILGDGATIVMNEFKRRLVADGSPPKHHWLGRR